MNNYDDAGMHEPFGPEYVRPANADCPHCACCTAALCEKGRASVLECAGHVQDGMRETVTGCPCSSESTPGSLAWRAMRIRAVTLATEKPLPAQMEVILTGIAHGQVMTVSDDVKALVARGLITSGTTELTEYGRRYLEARTQARQSTAVEVIDVDVKTRMARVMLAGRFTDRPVTVPMDQLANGHTALKPSELPGAVLYAQANVAADSDDDVILTQVRNVRMPRRVGTRADRSGGGR